MFVEVYSQNGKQYIRLVTNERKLNKQGKMVPCKISVKSFGPLEKYDDGNPDYVQRLKESFVNGQPLIDGMKEYCTEANHALCGLDSTPKNMFRVYAFSQKILERIMEELGLQDLFASLKYNSRIKYDLYGFLRLLVFGRILDPKSKIKTVDQNDWYYTPILSSGYSKPDVYKTLTVVYNNMDKITQRINTNLAKKTGFPNKLLFYDVTNWYFEMKKNDEDIYDDDGELVQPSFRHRGHSKEERHLPIVQAGLFMNEEGIPIAIKVYPGNTQDATTVQPSLESIKGIAPERFIVVADRGHYNKPNAYAIIQEKNGYIMAKSIAKSDKDDKAWILDQNGYNVVSESFKYKSKTIKREVSIDNETKVFMEKMVVYWSEGYYQECVAKHADFEEAFKKKVADDGTIPVRNVISSSVSKNTKNKAANRKTGELTKVSNLGLVVDDKKSKDDEKYFGYYLIVTSELEMDDLEVISTYHNLSEIEEQFKIMKGTLETRPVYLSTMEHITAHIYICFIGLLLTRLIQYKITAFEKRTGAEPLITPKKDKVTKQNKKPLWTTGLPGSRLQDALNELCVTKRPNGKYVFKDYTQNKDLTRLLETFNIIIEDREYSLAELNEFKKNIRVF